MGRFPWLLTEAPTDFTTKTRSLSVNVPIRQADEIFAVASALLDKTDAKTRPIRLLGVSISSLVECTDLN